jgi:class 3 adenylate cyclase/tetratricopeptide (TPR) repeat protein
VEERRVVTALFCDLVGSTSLGEKSDPEELDRLLGRYYELASAAIDRHGGSVEKFIGDAVVALFGYPVAHEDDPIRALRAALEVVEAVEASALEVEVRLGINTGEAFLRVQGSGEWNAAGDVMNTASRLQAAAPPMGIVVGARTRSAARRGFEFAELPALELKGKDDPVAAWRLLGTIAAESDDIGTATLVGREDELGRLMGAVASLDGHGGKVVLVEGDAGIGKSRLVRETRESGATVTWLRGRSIETRDAGGYRAFAELILTWAGSPSWEALAGRAQALGLAREQAGFLATMAGVEPDLDLVGRFGLLDADAMRPHLYRSVLAWLDALSEGGPLVLEFEDWHWADGGSVQLAEHVMPLIESRPLLLLMVARPGSDPARSISELVSAPLEKRIARIELMPLGADDAATLLGELLAGHDVSAQRLTGALGRAEGNPYFLHELARLLTEDGQDGALPDSVRAVVTTRVDRLAPDLKALLRTAAVIGRTFADELLARIEPDDTVQPRLERLVATRLIELVPPGRHRFVHALTREAVYESTPLADRKRLHAKAAETLTAERQAANLPAIAYHLAQAEDWGGATDALLAAGEQATRIAADDEALEMYRRAIDAHARLPDDRWSPVERSRIDRHVAEALQRLGRRDEAAAQVVGALDRLGVRLPASKRAVQRAVLRDLLRLSFAPPSLPPDDATPDPVDVEIDRELQLLSFVSFFGDHDRFALAALLLTKRAARANDLIGIALGASACASIFPTIGRAKLARKYAARATEAAERIDDPIEAARVWQDIMLVPLAIGGWPEARDCGLRAIDVATSAGDLRSWGSSTCSFVVGAVSHGDIALTRSLSAELIARAAASGDHQIAGFGHTMLAIGELTAGDLDAASAHADEGIAMTLRVPDFLAHVAIVATLARIRLRQGDREGALASITESRATAEARGFRGYATSPLLEAEAELALLDLAQNRNRTTIRTSRRQARASLREARAARWHAVHAHILSGGHAWVVGDKRAAARAFHKGAALAQTDDWQGSLALATAWIEQCCRLAEIEPPPRDLAPEGALVLD